MDRRPLISRRPARCKSGLATARLGLALSILAGVTGCQDEAPVVLPETRARLAELSADTPPGPAAATASLVPIVVEDPPLPVETRDGWIRGRPVPAEGRSSADFHARIVAEELARYPAPLLKRIGLKEFVLCETLSLGGTDCYAYSDVEHGRIYLSVRAGYDGPYVRRVVHHETFHHADFADDGRIDSDPRWELLNPPGFRYTDDVERAQADPDLTRPDDRLPGFLNRYSMSSPAEDKAELFASLIVERDRVRRRASGDGVIRRKVERLKETFDRLGPYGRAVIEP